MTEPVWDLGAVSKREVVEKIIRIKNAGSDKLIIEKVRSSCDCIALEMLDKEAEEDEFAMVMAIFDATKGVSNKFTKYIYIQSNDPNKPVARITVRGVIENRYSGEEVVGQNISELETSGTGEIEVVLFFSPDCRGCKQIKNIFLRELGDRYDVSVKCYDIAIMDNYLKLMNFEKQYGVKENDPMIVFTGDRYFSGKTVILKELEPYVKHLLMIILANFIYGPGFCRDIEFEKGDAIYRSQTTPLLGHAGIYCDWEYKR